MRKRLVYLSLRTSTIILFILCLAMAAMLINTAFFSKEETASDVLSPEGQETAASDTAPGVESYNGIAIAPFLTQPKEEEPPEPPKEEEEEPEPPPVKKQEPKKPSPPWTKPNLELKGTIIGGPSGDLAIIAAAKTRKEGLYAVDDEVEGARVIKILRNKVTLIFRGREFDIELAGGKSMPLAVAPDKKESDPGPGSQRTPSRQTPIQEVIKVNRTEVMKQASNLAEILTQVKIKPYYRYRQIRGFRVENIPSNSFIRKVGLKDGDVVTKVNGQTINSFSKAIQIGRKLQNESTVNVNVIRDGKEITLVYNLK